MHFTKSPIKQKTLLYSGTNNMGQHYSNVKVPIKNYSTTSLATRIDKNMTSFYIPPPPTKTEMEEYIRRQQIDIPLQVLQLKQPIIENVYQEKYNYYINATGLGDFIRGSYFLMEFCDNHDIPFNINILNHPISQFLELYENKQRFIYNNINKFELRNFNPHISEDGIITNVYDPSINDGFIRYLSKQHVFKEKIYVYTVAYPSDYIAEQHKEYMKRILTPSKSLSLLVDNTISELGLIKNQFTIIHIRYGDDFLIKNIDDIEKSHLEVFQNTFDSLDLTQTYLLISDNTTIKTILSSQYPFIKTHFNEISHTGEGTLLETKKLQNTMIDFNLFSHAANVIAFSTYKHGTGFSKWSAETYSVPYSCQFLS
jgi:hypothetical protein